MASIVTKEQRTLINKLVEHYAENRRRFQDVLDQLKIVINGAEELQQYIHSVKSRVKDPDHLRDKLYRKLAEAKKQDRPFTVSEDNLFYRMGDLAGFRILHLHTRQMGDLNTALLACLDAARYKLIEGPVARTWDDETREYFKEVGIPTKKSGDTMYTSVHYVIEPNSRERYRCEVQVRTLAEELWGEVDHSINYPHKSKSLACREQIKALARATSTCSRLVDSIFRSHEDNLAIRIRQRRRSARI